MRTSASPYLLLAQYAMHVQGAAPLVVPVVVYTLTGYNTTGTPYPAYNVSIPVNGVTIPISNPLIVYSISPVEDFNPVTIHEPTTNCTFTLEDGTQEYISSTFDIIPQRVTAVSCLPYTASSVFTSSSTIVGSATSSAPAATKTFATTSSATASTTAATTATAGAGANNGTAATGSAPGVAAASPITPFTGDATRVRAAAVDRLSLASAAVLLLGLSVWHY